MRGYDIDDPRLTVRKQNEYLACMAGESRAQAAANGQSTGEAAMELPKDADELARWQSEGRI